MTEEVLISVKGMHVLADDQDEEIEVISVGKYYFKNGKHYILYDEVEQENGTIIKNRITLRDEIMELQKNGSVRTSMTFQRDQKHTSLYNTPFGNMLAGITVNDMYIAESENLLEIKVKYELELNYEKAADCVIAIKIMAKDSGLFYLGK